MKSNLVVVSHAKEKRSLISLILLYLLKDYIKGRFEDIEPEDDDEERVRKLTKRRGVLYINFLNNGTLVAIPILKEICPGRFQVIDGSIDAAMRAEIVRQFNAGMIDIIVITNAGTEGLDLKGASFVFLFDTAWNDARHRQAEARAIRAGSHDHLPEALRHVEVVSLAMSMDERTDQERFKILNDKDLPEEVVRKLSTDEQLTRLSAEKKEIAAHADKIMKSYTMNLYESGFKEWLSYIEQSV